MLIEEDRLQTAQKFIFIMDRLLKDSNMSLVVRNGKPAILDHELKKVYLIENKITGDKVVDDEIRKHLI